MDPHPVIDGVWKTLTLIGLLALAAFDVWVIWWLFR